MKRALVMVVLSIGAAAAAATWVTCAC